MRPRTELLLAVEGIAAIALMIAAVSGEASLHSNGLHLTKLAYDRACDAHRGAAERNSNANQPADGSLS